MVQPTMVILSQATATAITYDVLSQTKIYIINVFSVQNQMEWMSTEALSLEKTL